MDRWLGELRSPLGEGPVRGGERQARAALRLAGRDPTVRRLALLEGLALTALWAAIVLLRRKTGSLDREADRVFAGWLYWVAASGIAAAFSVAVACAVDARIDGVEGDLRMAFGEVRRRLPAVLCWWLISMGGAIGLGYAATAVMKPLPAILTMAAVWGFGTLFVVPAIALQGGRPLEPFGEALRLLRARWGRALAGLFVIGFLFGLAFLACGFLLRATAESHPRTADEPLWRLGGPLLLFYLVYALTAATHGGFGVILARDALDDLPGEPPAAKPRRRPFKIVRRVVLAALALAVGLIVFGALLVHHRSNPAPTTPRTYVPATPPTRVAAHSDTSFAYPMRDPDARLLRPGAPVVAAGRTIGRVSMVHVERTSPLIEVFYEVDPRSEPTVIGSRMRVALRGGEAYMVVVPR